MNKLVSKIINVVLALISIVCFLALDFYGFGSSKNFTGAEVMEMIEDGEEIWPVLFVIIPVIHIIIRFLTQKIAGGILCGCLMLIPVITALAQVDVDYLQVGFYVYAVISVLMIFTPLLDLAGTPDSQTPADKSNQTRTMSDSQLQKIVDKPEMYNATLVSQCKEELDIRTNAQSMMPEVETYNNEKIDDILKNKGTYSAAIVFCCKTVKAERIRKEAEEQRKEQERIAKEKDEKRKSFWAKWRWVIIGTITAVFTVVCAIYFTSNTHYNNCGINYYKNDNAEKAIKQLSKIENINYENYLDAKYVLFDIYMTEGDTTNATQAMQDVYAAVKDREIAELNTLYNPHVSREAYEACAYALMEGIECIEKDYVTALNLFTVINDPISCGVCYYHMGDYIEAFQTIEEYDNWRASIYKGLMYAYGNGCTKDTYKAYKCFSQVAIEDFIEENIETIQSDWFHLDGDMWNIDIIKEYLIYKSDLSLIHGSLEFRASTYGKGFEDAKECISLAARIFPNDARFTRRNEFITKMAEKTTENMKRTGNYYWTYFGEYIKDYSYSNGIRPYGYGIYEEESKGWDKNRQKLVIGKFGKDGREFTWSDESLYIFYDKDDSCYYVGYWEKGKFHFMSHY